MGVYGDIVTGLSGTNVIPEPASILLLVSTGLGLLIRRRKQGFTHKKVIARNIMKQNIFITLQGMIPLLF